MIGWILLALVVVGAAYIRLAPDDAARWHVPVEASESRDLAGGAIRIVPGTDETFARIDRAARALPRTQVLAGSLDEKRITYVTRSRVFGFPDYTTVELNDGELRLFARLRFGRSDMGVNAARLDGLLAAIQ